MVVIVASLWRSRRRRSTIGPMADFTPFHIQTSDPEVSIVGRRGGEGPPLLLLHGNPLTNLSCRTRWT